MDSIDIPDEKGLLWTARIQPGGTAVGNDPDKNPTPELPVLEFCRILRRVAEKSHLNKYSHEELKTILKDLQQSQS